MNNDILKFRVWDNQLNQYITDTFEVAIKNNGKLINRKGCLIKNCIIERCTGKTDKNKNLIYVGDVVTNGKFTASIVEHENGGWGLGCIPSGAISILDARYLYPLEIIGNVHEESSNGHD
jgi:hypothetical protein